MSIALDFLEKKHGIKLIGVDSASVVDGNVRLLLGLMWTLVQEFQIKKLQAAAAAKKASKKQKSAEIAAAVAAAATEEMQEQQL